MANNDNSFYTWLENRNIKPIKIENKDVLYKAVMNIEHSWSGRICNENSIINTFICESSQLLINSVKLFELGYFDCAFYSIREAIDLSTTVVFLTDITTEEKENFKIAWRTSSQFPLKKEMIKELKNKGEIFSDFKNKLSFFLIEIKDAQDSLNKYVHKQGFKHFYVSRNHPLSQNKTTTKFEKDFLYYFKIAVKTVAVMRLVIDPFPVLLMDEDILYRCFDSLTEPYEEQFVKEYIGNKIIENYKLINFYKDEYNNIIRNEKKNISTFDLMKYKIIDTKKEKDIIKQLHLLSNDDQLAANLIFNIKKITKLNFDNGLSNYYTDRDTVPKIEPWSFSKQNNNKASFNKPYNEKFISILPFNNSNIQMIHTILFSTQEIEKIKKIIQNFSQV